MKLKGIYFPNKSKTALSIKRTDDTYRCGSVLGISEPVKLKLSVTHKISPELKQTKY